MATVASQLLWATHEAALKNYLDIELADTSEDTELMLWLTHGAEACDLYLEQEFDLPHPKAFELGVYELVKELRSQVDKNVALNRAKTGQLEEGFAAEILSIPEVERIANRFWKGYAAFRWLKAHG